MNLDHPSTLRNLRHAHGALFCLNIALVAFLALELTTRFPLLLHLQYLVNEQLGLHPHSQVGAYAALLGLAVGVAAVLFSVLLASSGTRLTRGILRSVAGFTAVMGLPACWFYVISVTGQPPFGVTSMRWPLLETAMSAVLTAWYWCRSSRFSAGSFCLLLVFHFGFWCVIFFRQSAYYHPVELVFPLVGMLATVAWGIYVSQSPAASGAGGPATHGVCK